MSYGEVILPPPAVIHHVRKGVVQWDRLRPTASSNMASVGCCPIGRIANCAALQLVIVDFRSRRALRLATKCHVGGPFLRASISAGLACPHCRRLCAAARLVKVDLVGAGDRWRLQVMARCVGAVDVACDQVQLEGILLRLVAADLKDRPIALLEGPLVAADVEDRGQANLAWIAHRREVKGSSADACTL